MEKVYEGNLVEIFRVTPNVYFRRADLNTRRQCNSIFLVGEHSVGIVDLPSMEAAEEIEAEVSHIISKPIRHIFLTHGHSDHANGLPAVVDRDVTIFCSSRLIDRLPCSSYRATLVGVDRNMPLYLSGLPVELFTLPETAHSPWDMFIRLPEMKIVCTGDAVVEFQTCFFHSSNIDSWISQLQKLAQKDDRLLLPGHGGVYAYSYMNEFADHLSMVREAAYECFLTLGGKTLQGPISEERIRATVDQYFAAGSKRVHTIADKAGLEAQREVRMVLWHMVMSRMR